MVSNRTSAAIPNGAQANLPRSLHGLSNAGGHYPALDTNIPAYVTIL